MCVYVYVYVYAYAYVNVYVDVSIYKCIYIYIFIYTYVYMYSYIYICMYVSVCTQGATESDTAVTSSAGSIVVVSPTGWPLGVRLGILEHLPKVGRRKPGSSLHDFATLGEDLQSNVHFSSFRAFFHR